MLLQLLNPDSYQFTIYNLPALCVGLVTGLVGLFVLIRERFSRIGNVFLLLCAAIAIYLLGAALRSSTSDPALALFFSRIATSGAVIIPSAWLLLGAVQLGLVPRLRPAVTASCLGSLLFFGGVYLTDSVVSQVKRLHWGYMPLYGPLGYLFILFFVGIMALVFSLYLAAYRNAVTERQRKRFLGTLQAFGIGSLGAVDFIQTLGVPLYPFGFLPLLAGVLIIASVVTRYRLVDITPKMAAGQILETMQGAVIVTDREGAIQVVNRAAQEMLGRPAVKLIGTGLGAIVEIPEAIIAAVQGGRRPPAYELEWSGENGRLDVSLCASPLTEEGSPELVGIVYVAHDITERRQADDALRERERRYNNLFGAVSDALFVHEIGPDGAPGKFVEVNDVACRYLGYSRQELLNLTPAEIEAPEADLALPPVIQRLAAGEDVTFEQTHLAKDGRRIAVEIHARAFQWRLQPAVISLVRDVSERKKATEALQESELRHRAILETVQAGIVIIDAEAHTIIEVNPAAAKMIGAPREQIIGSGCHRNICPAEEGKCPITDLQQTVDNSERILLKADGSGLPVIKTVAPVILAGHRCLIESFVDISERKKSEEMIRKLSMAVEQSPATIMITNTGGAIEYVNPSFSWTTGYAADEVLGKNPSILQSGETPRAEYGRLWATIKEGLAWQGEFCNRKKNGELYWESATIAPITDNGGAVTHYVAIKEDITERRAAAQQVRQAKEEWERTFDAIADPIMILDTKHRIVKANKAMAAALKVTPAEAVGMTCCRAVHGAETPPEFCPHARLLLDGMAHTKEVHEPSLGGYLHISVSPLYALDGTLIGSIHAARDITALKKAEQLNVQYSHDLEQLLAVSQEITATSDLASLYRLFVATAQEVLALDFSTLMLLSADKQKLTVHDTLGFPASEIGTYSLCKGQGLSTLVAHSLKPDQVADFASETRFEVPAIVRENHIRSALAVPMMMKGEAIGVLVGHTRAPRKFSANDLAIYQQIGNQAALAIQNARNSARLRKSEQNLQDITSSLGEGVYVLDSDGKITFMNPEAESLLGWTQAELADQNIHDVIHNRKADGSPLSWEHCPIHNVIITGQRYVSHDEVFSRKDQSRFPVSIISAPIFEDSQVVASVTSFRDISDIKEAEEALNQANQLLELQAITDPLTGIYNRLRFDKVLSRELARSRRHAIPLSLVMFDIDHFKRVNDFFGHQMGDLVLKDLTAKISLNIRKHDYFARWGGEEFMILLPHTARDNAAHFAEKCRQRIEELRFEGLGGITCSFGVAELMLADDISSFTKRVDEALYQAKAKGRNRVEVQSGS